MRTSWKWRWATTILIFTLSLIVIIFTSNSTISLYIIVISILGNIGWIYKILIAPKIKEKEEEEKRQKKVRNFEQERLQPIKRIIELLENYEDIKNNVANEKKSTGELVELFPKLLRISFKLEGANTIKDKKYIIHKSDDCFYIKKNFKGFEISPSENYMYYSNIYFDRNPDLKHNETLLSEFIDYLRMVLKG